MSDPISQRRRITSTERSQYWRETKRETWELSREQFQLHHGIIIGTIALVFRWYIRGWEDMVSEFLTSLFYIAAPVGLYLVGLYLFNFVRAMIRVPVHRQRETARLAEEIKHMTYPQLQFEFPEAELKLVLDQWNTGQGRTPPVAFVKVRNPTARTIDGVSVRIVSIVKLDEPEDPDYTHYLKNFIGLPLMIRSGGALLPIGELPQKVTIDSGNEALFNVLLLDPPQPYLLHAVRNQSPQLADGRGGTWIAFPPMKLSRGRHRLQLRTQGKDTPPAMLTLEFTHIHNKREVQQVTDPSSLS